MKLTEIKIGGIYVTRLKVQFREEREIHDVTLLVRVTEKLQNGCIRITFLNDPECGSYILEPRQIESVS